MTKQDLLKAFHDLHHKYLYFEDQDIVKSAFITLAEALDDLPSDPPDLRHDLLTYERAVVAFTRAVEHRKHQLAAVVSDGATYRIAYLYVLELDKDVDARAAAVDAARERIIGTPSTVMESQEVEP